MDQLELQRRMMDGLPEWLVSHLERTVAVARHLAERHGLDPEPIATAAQGHDLLRAVEPEELLALAGQLGHDPHPAEAVSPLLLHGPLAATLLERDYGCRDSMVLNAVRWHTQGHASFGADEWAVFLADKIDPHKVARRPALEPIAELAQTSLTAAARDYIDLVLSDAIELGRVLHPASIDARNALIAVGTEGVQP